MIKLLAYDPNTRWAFIEDNGKILQINPPRFTPAVTNMTAVGIAVTQQGWFASTQEFENLSRLYHFLSKESVKNHKEHKKRNKIKSVEDLNEIDRNFYIAAREEIRLRYKAQFAPFPKPYSEHAKEIFLTYLGEAHELDRKYGLAR
jgi:hypothetical protein